MGEKKWKRERREINGRKREEREMIDKRKERERGGK